jgi:hypothetical protein
MIAKLAGKRGAGGSENQERIEIPMILLYNLCMEEIIYLLAGFIHHFNTTKHPAKREMIKVGK